MEKSLRFLKNAADNTCVFLRPRPVISRPNAEYEKYEEEDHYTTNRDNADAEPDFILF
jgi:hypothetical protein